MLILNDIHIGHRRMGGTTHASREAMREYLLLQFSMAMEKAESIVIAGDLFDDFEVEARDWLATFLALKGQLEQGRPVVLVAGNHDHSPKANKVSSFETLCAALECDNFTAVRIDEYRCIGPGVWALAHCSNQDVFNIKLDELLERVCAGHTLILHANFDNNFAAQSDHSLNVSREVAKSFIDKGCHLLFAHEHQARTAFSGALRVMGNQWPTSIADCLNNNAKYLHIVDEEGVREYQSWNRNGDAGFAELDWRELVNTTDAAFIRVIGTATAAEASDVISAIAAFRQRSDAFVITNAVQIDGIAEADTLPEQFEAAKAFDVMQYIKQHLEPEEITVVEKLLENS